jgi:hypothetical protein
MHGSSLVPTIPWRMAEITELGTGIPRSRSSRRGSQTNDDLAMLDQAISLAEVDLGCATLHDLDELIGPSKPHHLSVPELVCFVHGLASHAILV